MKVDLELIAKINIAQIKKPSNLLIWKQEAKEICKTLLTRVMAAVKISIQTEK